MRFFTFSLAFVFCVAASAGAPYSYVGKCSETNFAVPNSVALDQCSECAIDDEGLLTCTCPSSSGPKTSQLPLYFCPKYYPYPLCAGPVDVVDGELTCKKIDPASKYKDQGCFKCTTEDFILKCECVKEKREHAPTKLDLSTCDKPVSSCLGILTCGFCPEKHPPRKWTWLKTTAISVSIIAVAFVSHFFRNAHFGH